MGIQDRDYMREGRRVTRASDQRSPGDPRTASDIFLPGTVHARPRRRGLIITVTICAVIAAALVIALAR